VACHVRDAHLKPGARQTNGLRQQFIAALRFGSGVAEAAQHEMVMLVMNKSSWRGLGQVSAGWALASTHQCRADSSNSSRRILQGRQWSTSIY
jgi:hypothetical protein